MIFELVPPTLEADGLGAAVAELLGRLSEEDGIETDLDDRLEVEPAEPARTVCFRIVQEALRNVGKHAHARSVQVVLEGSGDELHARVHDDGRGFDAGSAPQPGHYGVTGIHERAEEVGGRLELRSAPGRGTTVELWIPLAAPG